MTFHVMISDGTGLNAPAQCSRLRPVNPVPGSIAASSHSQQYQESGRP